MFGEAYLCSLQPADSPSMDVDLLPHMHTAATSTMALLHASL